MTLSIITINKDNSTGLERTVNSVISQSFRDFEYIIVDGNSCDNSVDIIKEHENDVTKMVWVSEVDSGIFDAMNKGIRLASGTYLLFLNSGDVLDSNDALQSVFKDDHQSDIIIGECRVMDKDRQIWLSKPEDKYTLKSLVNSSIPHQSSFIRKDLFNRYGLYRDDLRIMGDWEFFMRTIIINNCTVEPCHHIISRYDTEGVSSNPRNKELIQKEKEKVYSSLHLGNIIPDYIESEKWFKEHPALLWTERKKGLYCLIRIIYNAARRIKNS